MEPRKTDFTIVTKTDTFKGKTNKRIEKRIIQIKKKKEEIF